jgi:pyruvate ferredoxin oxidoreductase beta subunit
VESGLFPVFEARYGEVTSRYTLRRRVPVEDYLKLQRRFAHLFGKNPDRATLARIQAIADKNIEFFQLSHPRVGGDPAAPAERSASVAGFPSTRE